MSTLKKYSNCTKKKRRNSKWTNSKDSINPDIMIRMKFNINVQEKDFIKTRN